jgi:DNA-directed RNA polymerase
MHDQPSVASVALEISARLEKLIDLPGACAADPVLARRVHSALLRTMPGRSRLVLVPRDGRRPQVKVIQWDESATVRTGALLVQLFSAQTGLIVVKTFWTAPRQSATLVVPCTAALALLSPDSGRAEIILPPEMPTVVPPADWSDIFRGGYAEGGQRGAPLIRLHVDEHLAAVRRAAMPGVYAAVNTLQASAWGINTEAFRVIDTLWKSGRSLFGGDPDNGGSLLPPREDIPLPAKSWATGDEPDEARLHAWKVDAAKTYEKNAKVASKRIQLVQKLWAAEKMMEHGNRFHFVYNLDWRGRMYPVASSLSPQGDDSAKALLRFTRGVPLGDNGAYWLAIHGANSFGVDKVSFEERIEWVEANTADVLRAASRPLEQPMRWARARQPFTFLAFCFEWSALKKWTGEGGSQSDFVSGLSVGTGMACSGLQPFPDQRIALRWLKDVGRAAARAKLPIAWTTPAGFPVVQDYRENLIESLDFQAAGRRFRISLAHRGDAPNTRRQSVNFAPNFVHSLDSALMTRAVEMAKASGVNDFDMQGQTINCHAANVQTLRLVAAHAFRQQYAEPILQNLRNELHQTFGVSVKLPSLPSRQLLAIRRWQ